jgi:hypothetical protein
MYSLPEWLQLDDDEIAPAAAHKAATAVIYLNGTRRWFLSQNKDWADYARSTGRAQRQLSQLFYNHGLTSLIQPLLGYDLLERGPLYLKLAVEQGLAELASKAYLSWYHQGQIRVTLYGNWAATLTELGFGAVVDSLRNVIAETQGYSKRRLLLGVFADGGMQQIVSLSRQLGPGQDLRRCYYGQPVGPVDIIVGSGQPAIWDLPLLDINKASLYFLQAPTFCLDKETLRRILYDHIYERVNDDQLYEGLRPQEWRGFEILGLGKRSRKGWIAT